MGVEIVPYLVKMLGKIGKNQYRTLPTKPFKKKNYPLPRDMAARTITKIGKDALPYLEEVLLTGEQSQVSEANDAIGFITFYSKDLRALKSLQKCKINYENNELI